MGGKLNRHIVSLLCCSLAAAWVAPASAQSPATEPTPAARDVQADLIEEETDGSDLDVYLATAVMQPAPAASSLSTRGAAGAPAARSSARPSVNRLASAPDMFGDFFMSGGNLNFGRNNSGVPNGQNAGSFTVPGAGGSRRVKIAENNKAMPTDRLIFSYNHFENALQFTDTPLGNPGAAVRQTSPIDRCTIGIEKTFFDGLWSCEVRMPFVSEFDFQSPAMIGDGGKVGNLAVIIKRLLVEDEDFAVVMGLGIDIPTGSDFTLDDLTAPPAPSRLTFHNDSLHLLPYTGFLFAGDNRPYFINAFLQVDVATAGNRIEAGPVNGPPAQLLGRFNEQNLLFADLGTGYWLHRTDDPDATLTSLAALLEFHYTTSLQDTDVVVGDVQGRPFNYRNNFNRFDITNVTTGVQARFWDNTSIRVAGVFPLGSRDDQRFFDSEVQVQINRQF